MFRKNSTLRCIFVLAAVARRSRRPLVQQNGQLRRPKAGRACGRLWETGNKPVSPITGSRAVRLYGPQSGRQRKLRQAVITKRVADASITPRLTVNAPECCKGFGIGSRVCLVENSQGAALNLLVQLMPAWSRSAESCGTIDEMVHLVERETRLG